jgi:DNA-binding response OmpR family regulator
MARILVVDDDPDLREACQLILESEGHEVSCAPGRSEGMAAVEKQTPELLILDVMMEQPDDGIQMAQELKRKGFKFPILMMTSIGKVTGMDYNKDSEMVPVDEFVEKPVEPKVLIEKVNMLLAN